MKSSGKLFIVLLSLCLVSSQHMTGQSFEKANHIISPGFGIGGIYPVFNSVNYRTPLFGLSYEYAAFTHVGPGSIGIGGFAGYKSFKRINEIGDNSFYEKLHYIILGCRGSYHYNPFPQVEGLDPYAGLMLSFNIPDYANNYSSNYKYLENKYRGYLAGTVYIGTRYYFSDYVGAFAEAGFGSYFFNLGMNFKF